MLWRQGHGGARVEPSKAESYVNLRVTFSVVRAPDGWLWKLSIVENGKRKNWGGVRVDEQSARNAINARLARVWSQPRVTQPKEE